MKLFAVVLVIVMAWAAIFFGGKEIFFDRPDSPPPERGTGEIVTND
jgi:hypothetical protein